MLMETVRDYAAMSEVGASVIFADAMKKLAKGEPTPFLPASYLWRHPDYRFVYTTDKIAL